MQEEINNFLDFKKRTDLLAKKRKCNVEDLWEPMGLTRASFFNYRNKPPKNREVWEKLQAFERKNGIYLDDNSPDAVREKVQDYGLALDFLDELENLEKPIEAILEFIRTHKTKKKQGGI